MTSVIVSLFIIEGGIQFPAISSGLKFLGEKRR